MRERIFDVLCGLMIVAGSVLFLNGGRQHPATDPRLGPMGSESYFRAFAEVIVADHHWESMHGQILVGPVLWALGAVALRKRLRLADSSWHDVAVVALTTGAAAWVLAFVFDGFVAPAVAAAVLERPMGQPFSFLELRANQLVVIRSGLIGWVLIGAGIAALSVAMLTRDRLFLTGLGLIGLAIGLWPIAAWWTGSFAPGPFVSPLWRTTALVTAAWFALAGATLFAPPKLRVSL
jgi:hypothetical protein